jgi:hypothetical protein
LKERSVDEEAGDEETDAEMQDQLSGQGSEEDGSVQDMDVDPEVKRESQAKSDDKEIDLGD